MTIKAEYNFKEIDVSVVMDKKENDIDSKELNVSSENPTFDLKAIRESDLPRWGVLSIIECNYGATKTCYLCCRRF